MVKQAKRPAREVIQEKATNIEFRTPAEVIKALSVADHGVLKDSLTALRNQLTVKHDEDAIPPLDSRLVLARALAEHSPGLPQFFGILSVQQQGPQNLQPLVLNTISHVLTLLSKHADAHSSAAPILKTIYTPAIQGRLTGYLSGGQNDSIIGALKIFNAAASFPSGGDLKQAMEHFPWGLKALPKLLFMRRKGKDSLGANDMMYRPDIRTLYMQFILKFVSRGCPSSVKSSFLEQHRDVFLSIFKGLHQDPYVVARHVLETCWEGLWGDGKVSRNLKLACFHEGTFQQILKLYERGDPEIEEDPESVPANLAHHFLLGLTTKPGFGVCFKDRGWYLRSEEASDGNSGDKTDGKSKGSKIHNKILSNIVKTLKVNEDARQQELALRIFGACPELVAGYWGSAGLTLEPRLSLKWMTNVNFLASVLSLPVPTETFVLQSHLLPSTSTSPPASSIQYQPVPPPAQSLLENTLPSTFTKSFITKGLQNASPLVQHTTASALCRCLTKFESVTQLVKDISSAQEESDEHGLWANCLKQYRHDIAKRLPDYRAVVAFAQQSSTTTPVTGNVEGKAPQFARTSETADMLNEVALRLVLLYFTHFPDLVAEVKFDTGKLFERFASFNHKTIGDGDAMDVDGADDTARIDGFWRLRLLHVLRLLEADPHFSWSTTTGTNKEHTHLYTILMTRSQLPDAALKAASSRLITKLLGSGVLFEHDPDELGVWLSCLPDSEGSGSSSSRGDAQHVISFLDQAVQTCLKTPYRYVEETLKIWRESRSPNDKDEMQGDTAIDYRSLPSPLIAACFEEVRTRLSKTALSDEDISLLPPVVSYIRALIFLLVGKQPDLKQARWFLRELESFASAAAPKTSSVIRAALTKEVATLRTCLRQLEEPASGLTDGVSDFLEERSSFEWLLLGTDQQSLELSPRVEELSSSFFSEPLDEASLRRRFGFLLHRLKAVSSQPSLVGGYLSLIGQMLRTAPASLSERLKTLVFLDTPYILQFLGPDADVSLTQGGIYLAQSLDPRRDQYFVGEIVSSWMPFVTGIQPSTHDVLHLKIWISFAREADFATIMDSISRRFPNVDVSLVESVLQNIEQLPVSSQLELVTPHTHLLCQLANQPWGVRKAERLFRTLLEAAIPMVINSSLGRTGEKLSTLISTSGMKSNSQLDGQVIPMDIWLDLLSWSRTRDEIVARLLYIFPASRPIYWSWVKESNPYKSLGLRVVTSLAACFDTIDFDERPLSDDDVPCVQDILRDIVRAAGEEENTISSHLISNLFSALASNSSTPLDLSKTSKTISKGNITLCEVLLRSFNSLTNQRASRFSTLRGVLIDRSLSLIGDALQDGWAENLSMTSKQLGRLVRESKGASPQTAEAFLMAVSQAPIFEADVLDLAICIAEAISLKPSVVNKVIQLMVNHPKFRTTFAGSTSDKLASFVSALFNKHPTNTCQTSHIAPLIHVFKGTSSLADRKLMSIFSLFEKERKVSVTYLLSEWQADSTASSETPSPITILCSLNPSTVFQSCLMLSNRRTLENASTEQAAKEDGESRTYDCNLILLLVASALSSDAPPSKHLVWVELFRSNVFVVALRSLSLKDRSLRKLGYLILAATWKALKNVEFQEKPHVLYFLSMVKALRAPQEEFKRLPTHTSLLLAYAFRGIFYPSHFLYPHTSRHLLERPELDCNNVPMLLGMMFSSTDDWKKERFWMLRFIRDGLKSLQDWKLLRRRHVLELLTSQFEASEDVATRSLILEIIHKAVQIPAAITTLITRHSWLTWMEMQILKAKVEEIPIWASILEDIGKFAEADLLDKLTDQNWKVEMHRCLTYLLGYKVSFVTLLSISRAFHSTSTGEDSQILRGTLSKAVNALIKIEPELDPPIEQDDLKSEYDEARRQWASIVETLWRISMTLDHRAAEWHALNSRMLIWRGYSGESAGVFEWVRKQTALRIGSS